MAARQLGSSATISGHRLEQPGLVTDTSVWQLIALPRFSPTKSLTKLHPAETVPLAKHSASVPLL